MVEKICLDTDAIIDIIKDTPRAKKLFEQFGRCLIFTTTINVFELHLRRTNLNQIDQYLAHLDILPFDEGAAVEASNIQKSLRQKGRPADFRDIFIAAISKVNNCALITFNKKDFQHMPGVKLT